MKKRENKPFSYGKSFVLAVLILFGFSPATSLLAQDLQILSVDSSNYPQIKVSVIYKGKTKFGQQDLTIKQDKKEIPYSIRESAPGSAPEKGRAAFFLIEASGNTYGKTLVNFREGVLSAFDNLETGDFVNAGSFGSEEIDSAGLHLLSKDFTTNHYTLRQALKTQLAAYEDSLSRSDLYKNILSSLTYISEQKELPQNKIFVVLCTARNNSKSPVTSSDCIAKAKEMGIPIYTITYLTSDSAYSSGMLKRMSDRTGGKSVQAKSQIDIINDITDFFNLPIPSAMQEAAYDIVFDIKQDINNPRMIKIDMNFRGTRQMITVSDPTLETLIPEDIKKYLWISIGILGIIVLLMILINLFTKRNKKERNNGETAVDSKTTDNEIAEIITTERPLQPSVNFEPSAMATPEISKKGGPMVLVSLKGRTQTFSLNKPETTIGRLDGNDIVLPEETVTRHHAKITVKGNLIEISDLGSTNGTFVNDVRIRTSVLKHGDKIRLGQVELTLKE